MASTHPAFRPLRRAELELGAEYAVRFFRPSGQKITGVTRRGWSRRVNHGVPAGYVVRHCTLVDKRSNGRLVVQYEEMKPTRRATSAWEIINQAVPYERGWTVVEVGDRQVLRTWAEQEAIYADQRRRAAEWAAGVPTARRDPATGAAA